MIKVTITNNGDSIIKVRHDILPGEPGAPVIASLQVGESAEFNASTIMNIRIKEMIPS